MNGQVVVVVADEDASSLTRAEDFAERLTSRVAARADLPDEQVCLFVAAESLKLGRAGRKEPSAGISWKLRRPGSSGRDPLLRAVGPTGARVFDATAGFDEAAFARESDLELFDEPEPDRIRVIVILDASADDPYSQPQESVDLALGGGP